MDYKDFTLKTHDDFPILIALDRQLPLSDETDKKFIKFSDSRKFDSDIQYVGFIMLLICNSSSRMVE